MAAYWFSYYFDRLKREFPRQVYRILEKNGNLSAILDSTARIFEIFEDDAAEFELSLNPMTASGFWLDFWFDFFNESRFYSETDDQFRTRSRSSLMYGKNSEQALIEAIRPMVGNTPTVNESRGKILQNQSYTSYNYDTQYDGQAFIIILKYRPPTANNVWFVGRNYIGYNNYAYDASGGKTASLQQSRINDIVAHTKLAGIKVIHDQT
jgi:hypothetical protein